MPLEESPQEADVAALCEELGGILNRNSPLRGRPRSGGKWNLLWSSLNQVEDAEFAVRAFEPPSDAGAARLAVTGLLQSLYLQQGAVRTLSEALNVSVEIDPELRRIAELRNCTAGHPTKREPKRLKGEHAHEHRLSFYWFVEGDTLHYYGACDECDYKPNEESHEESLREVVSRQAAGVARALRKIVEGTKAWLREHRARFASEKLIGLFPPTLDYDLGVVVLAGDHAERSDDAHHCVEEFLDSLDKLREALAERKWPLAELGFNFEADRLKAVLRWLARYFAGGMKFVPGNVDANVAHALAFFAGAKLKELAALAAELDDYYGGA